MAECIVDDTFVDFDAYLDANQAFHEGLVGLARNPTLLSIFDRLQLKGVMARAFGTTPATSRKLRRGPDPDRRGASSRGSRAAATAVGEYNRMAKARVVEILATTGGSL